MSNNCVFCFTTYALLKLPPTEIISLSDIGDDLVQGVRTRPITNFVLITKAAMPTSQIQPLLMI